jgi:hypothetical protein
MSNVALVMAHIGFSPYLHVEIRNTRIIVPCPTFDVSTNDASQKSTYGFVAWEDERYGRRVKGVQK